MPLIPVISPQQYAVVLRDLEEVLGLELGSVTSQDVGPALGAQYFAAVARRPAEGADRLAAALGERFREVLDPEEVTIAVAGESLSSGCRQLSPRRDEISSHEVQWPLNRPKPRSQPRSPGFTQVVVCGGSAAVVP